MTTSALAQRPQNGTALAQRLAPGDWSREYIDLLKEKYGRGCSDIEFAHAIQVSKVTGLRIDTQELWVYKRNANEPVTTTISINGLRAIAHASGVFGGEEGPLFCGKDGVYVDTWLADEPPVAAKFTVWRKDVPRPFTAIIRLSEFRNNSPFWRDRPVHQSGVRVATHAFRHAFRQEIAERQNQAEEAGLHLSLDAENAPPPGEEYAQIAVSEPEEAPARTAAPPVTSASGAKTGAKKHTRQELLALWNKWTSRAVTAGVDWEDLIPDFHLEHAKDEEFLEHGPTLRARVEAAEAKAAEAPPAEDEPIDAELRETSQPAQQDERAEPAETHDTDAPAATWAAPSSPEQLRAEWDALAAEALTLGVGSKAPPQNATLSQLADAIAALQPKVEAARAKAAAAPKK